MDILELSAGAVGGIEGRIVRQVGGIERNAVGPAGVVFREDEGQVNIAQVGIDGGLRVTENDQIGVISRRGRKLFIDRASGIRIRFRVQTGQRNGEGIGKDPVTVGEAVLGGCGIPPVACSVVGGIQGTGEMDVRAALGELKGRELPLVVVVEVVVGVGVVLEIGIVDIDLAGIVGLCGLEAAVEIFPMKVVFRYRS